MSPGDRDFDGAAQSVLTLDLGEITAGFGVRAGTGAISGNAAHLRRQG
jgi:hypothetical protein